MANLTSTDAHEINAFLSSTCEDVQRWLPAPAWRPAWRSEASRELDNHERSPRGCWGDRPVRTVYAGAAVFLAAAIDSVCALANSVDVQTTAFVPNVLARAAMEAGAQAWWMLEPGIGARRRVIRSVLIHAASARHLGKAVRAINPALPVTDYGEDQAAVRTYATDLGLTYACNDNTVECEGEQLPGYNQRAAQFEKANQMGAAYRIYSGAAHAEWYAVAQGWQPVAAGPASTPLWTRRPDREAVWAAAIASAGFVVVPAWRALTLLGSNARLVELGYHLKHVDELVRRMKLPIDWRA